MYDNNAKRRREDGRPRMRAEPTQMVAARVVVSGVRLLRRVGDGNLSEGLHRLILLYNKLPEALRDEVLGSADSPGGPMQGETEDQDRDDW